MKGGAQASSSASTSGQLAALEQLQRGAAAGREPVDAVRQPELGERRRRVAAAHHGRARRVGHRLGHGAGAGGERLELEGAHRAVPEHGAGAPRSRARRRRPCAGRRRGPSSRRAPRCRRARAARRRRRSGRRARGRCGSSRRQSLPSAAGQRPRASSTPSSSTSESPVGLPCGPEEAEAHRAADQQRVRHVEEALDQRDLVVDLRAAEHDHQRPVGALDDPAQRQHLALQQQAGRRRAGAPPRRRWRRARGAPRRRRRSRRPRPATPARGPGRGRSWSPRAPSACSRARAPRRRPDDRRRVAPGARPPREPGAPARRSARPGAPTPAAARSRGRAPSGGPGASRGSGAAPRSRSSSIVGSAARMRASSAHPPVLERHVEVHPDQHRVPSRELEIAHRALAERRGARCGFRQLARRRGRARRDPRPGSSSPTRCRTRTRPSRGGSRSPSSGRRRRPTSTAR